MKYVALRYFNAAGASSDGLIGEDHDPETHLIPLCLLAALGRRERLSIFGTDYPTPDGTCIRDYIHVDDLADAHVLALDYLAGGGTPQSLNVGTGRGHSVREVVACAAKVAGASIPVVETERRAGDPPILVAAAARIGAVLGWKPQYTELEPIIRTAWTWFQAGGCYDE
jgi:UDP-glucose 4-epimerase